MDIINIVSKWKQALSYTVLSINTANELLEAD